MTTTETAVLPTADELRTRAREALHAIGVRTELGEPGQYRMSAGSPVTGDVLFSLAEATPHDVDAAITEAEQAFTVWRTTPAPVRSVLVGRLGELLVQNKTDLA